ncbi:response regulator transcription factor [Bacillus piscicola]|uniref:response regulator transcription factor n=1 Tax=Bacillus piscicola TaxID=1632684 RepID=UPI001F08FE66
MPQKVLVVDDEQSISTLISYNLEQAGFQVEQAMDGKTAVDKIKTREYDVIVLDLMLPQLDGLEVCRQVREEKIKVPILMVTAKDEEFDKVLGLELGADDYLTKPFSPRELIARVKAILRRIDYEGISLHNESRKKEKIVFGDLTIYPESYEAYIHGHPIELTPKQFELLLYLTNNEGRVIRRDQLLNAVWHYEFVGDTRIVDVHISHLREKIEPDTKKPIYIKTVRGLGYKFERPRPVS